MVRCQSYRSVYFLLNSYLYVPGQDLFAQPHHASMLCHPRYQQQCKYNHYLLAITLVTLQMHIDDHSCITTSAYQQSPLQSHHCLTMITLVPLSSLLINNLSWRTTHVYQQSLLVSLYFHCANIYRYHQILLSDLSNDHRMVSYNVYMYFVS